MASMLNDPGMQERLARIRILILDVDGVMTDGRICMDGKRDLKMFDTKDGAGIKYLIRSGIAVAFVTGRQSPAVEQRAKDLGITECHQKALKKWPVVEELLHRLGYDRSEAAYVGDDLVDLPPILRVGTGIAVADAVEELRRHAHAITCRPGGRGAVREVAEAILRSQGKWDAIVDGYLQMGSMA